MKSIKILVIGLVLGLAGVVYAAGGTQNTPQSCDMKAGADCCATHASCCTGGSCCTAHIAKK